MDRLSEFRRACELGVLVGGAERTTHLFGRRINRHYHGKLQTVLDQREAGHPVLRWYYQTSFAKQYTRGDQHGDRILRTETCSNDTRHFGVGRRLENLPSLRERLAATNERCLELQAELLASAIDTGQLATLAAPTLIGQRRIPGLKLHDDRVIRLLETLLHPGGFVSDWTTRGLHTHIQARHQLATGEYRLGQLRYDLTKLRAKGLVERLGTSRRYRLTPAGLKLGVLLVKLRTRLLGPLATLVGKRGANPAPRHSNSVDAAFREVDTGPAWEVLPTAGIKAPAPAVKPQTTARQPLRKDLPRPPLTSSANHTSRLLKNAHCGLRWLFR